MARELQSKNEVLELNIKHLNERIRLNEEELKDKVGTISELTRETSELQISLIKAEESNLKLKS